MKYTVELSRSAEGELEALDRATVRRIGKGLLLLEENPRPQSAKKLRAREGYRLRVGDYRVLYRIDDARRLVTVLAIGHRREIYR